MLPASVQPGVKSTLILRGTKLPANLRVVSNREEVKLSLEKVADVEAAISIEVPSGTRPGPIGLWFATPNGPLSTKFVLVDDLATVSDNGNNHSIATAQSVGTLNAVDGVTEGTKADYYRFSAAPGQRVAFEVITQAIRSKMDPIVRLLSADGRVLRVADDDAIGPDCRFSYEFAEAGEYYLQISDSHYAAGGDYHLRIGDFPIIDHVSPLAIQRGTSARLKFLGPDGSRVVAMEANVPENLQDDFFIVPVHIESGKSSAWATVAASKFTQFVEPSATTESEPKTKQVREVPFGLSGQLEKAGERDSYWIKGTKGQSVRIASRTRSLGCATMLQMQLSNAAGTKLAETSVSEADEWIFDVTFPEDGEYRLDVGDLLKRGGSQFGYWIEVIPSGSFSIVMKADPKGRLSFPIEEASGGCAVELRISRFGYDGEIELSVGEEAKGIQILNPRIAANATEHRAIVLVNDAWKPDQMALMQMHAHAVGNKDIACIVSSKSQLRLTEQHVLYPETCSDGVFSLAGVNRSPSVFDIKPANKILWDSKAKTHTAVVQIERLKKEFKAAVSIDGSLLGIGWSVKTAADKDNLTLTFARPSPESDMPSSISLLAYTELADRVRWEKISLPVKWIERPLKLDVYPPAIELNGPNSQQQVVVTGFDAANQPRDWTHELGIVSTNTAIAKVQNNVVVPVANGTAEILIQLGETQQKIPVKVSSFEHKRPVAFESEVLVALSKQGCNSGACHGSPSGKGNFRLSLRAFDRVLDELTLVREDFGRRVNPMDPEQSILLLKPMMKLTHGGGKQLHRDDAAFQILKDWIAEGARPDPAETARCVRLEVYPSEKRVLKRTDGAQQLAATAIFSDGVKRDVTRLVAFESTNTEVATVDKLGFVTPIARGETVILVRYLEHIESIPLMFVDDVPGFEWSQPASKNYIDELVNAKLKQLQFQPAPTCSDAVFLRRVSMDVIGVLPTVQETNAFLSDSDPDKRSKLIDRLLERDEYPKFWALKWGDLLKMTSKSVGTDGVFKYHRWVESAIQSNMPYDAFARELLSATGSTLANPAANFYRSSTDMNECVETVSQVFLGARLQCAKCHNHPFERWTQDNYYGLGAFFNRLQRKAGQRPGEVFVWSASTGEVTQPRTGQVMKPWLPQVGSIETAAEQDRLPAFVSWLIDPKNPYFAKIEANRIWSQLFARGIVDPIDDFRDSNPPSNESLLDALAQDFADNGFDRKYLTKQILNSATYQATSETNRWNEKDKMYFSHQSPRMLSAEQLLDAINHVTGLTQVFAGLPADMKATQLPAPDLAKNAFLKVFGQPERSTVCACERSDDSNLGMAIELFNGPLIYEKLRDANNRFRKAHAAGSTAQEVIRELYLAALCRPPSDDEMEASIKHCESRGDLVSGFEDLCWVLLNTDEFLFQH